MKSVRLYKRIVGVAVIALLGMCVLFGCSAQQSEQQLAQEKNQAYMSQVNEAMESLKVKLNGFVDAVSRGDVVNMRTQADDAYMVLDELSSLEAPEGLQDIQNAYVDGTNELRNALNAYIDLYTEIDSATEDNPFDWNTFDTRITEINEQYDAGIALLQEGDKIASEKK